MSSLSKYIEEESEKEMRERTFGESESSIKIRFKSGFRSCIKLLDEIIEWTNKGKNPQYKDFVRANPHASHKELVEFYVKEIKKP